MSPETGSLADQWLNEIRNLVEQLDDSLEIDDYRNIFACTKVIRSLLQNVEDSCLEYLTGYQGQDLPPEDAEVQNRNPEPLKDEWTSLSPPDSPFPLSDPLPPDIKEIYKAVLEYARRRGLGPFIRGNPGGPSPDFLTTAAEAEKRGRMAELEVFNDHYKRQLASMQDLMSKLLRNVYSRTLVDHYFKAVRGPDNKTTVQVEYWLYADREAYEKTKPEWAKVPPHLPAMSPGNNSKFQSVSIKEGEPDGPEVAVSDKEKRAGQKQIASAFGNALEVQRQQMIHRQKAKDKKRRSKKSNVKGKKK